MITLEVWKVLGSLIAPRNNVFSYDSGIFSRTNSSDKAL